MSSDSGDTNTRPTFDSLPDTAWSDDPAPETASPAAADPQPTDTATASTPEPATTASATDQQAGEAPLPSGPIPLDRHKAILDAERKRYGDLDAKYQRTAFTDALLSAGKSPEDIQNAVAFYDSFQGNPTDTLAYVYEKLAGHPTIGPQVRSWAGKMLSGGRQVVDAQDPQQDPEPQPDRQDTEGTLYFSAAQMSKHAAWQARQLEAKFAQQIQPLTEANQRATAREREAAMAADANRTVAAQLEDMRQKPHFKEHEADIKAYLAERKFTGPDATLEKAYIHVLTTKVLPTLSAKEQASTVAKLKTQAAASSAKPSSGGTATPKRPRDFNDPGLDWS